MITLRFQQTCLGIAIFLLNLSLFAQSGTNVLFTSPTLLTSAMTEKHAAFVQELLDLRYTPAQHQKHIELIKDYWRKNDFTGMQNIAGNLDFAKQLEQLPREERAANIKKIRSALIMNLVDDAAIHEDSRWYLQNYLAAHPPLVNTRIPFIQEAADALIDCEYFINRELKNKPVQPVTAAQRQQAYQRLAQEWKSFSPDKQKTVLTGASQMALIFYRWKRLSALERIQIKKQYVGDTYLSAAEKRTLQAAQQLPQRSSGSPNWSLLQNEINFMKQSTDIIMSQGTRWNPATNRYEQIGGVVTEFW